MTESDGGAPSGGASRVKSLGLVGGLFVLSTAAAAYEIAPASVIPLVTGSMAVSKTAASGLVSVMYATAVVGSLPAGAALDRVGPRRAVTAAGLALLVAGATGWVAVDVPTFVGLLATRVLGGLAYVVIWNAGANLAGEAVSSEFRATAVGLFTASAPVGFAVGLFGAPLVASAAGQWHAVLPAFAAVAIVGLALFLGASRGRSLAIDAPTPDRASFRRLFGDRRVWQLTTLCCLAFSLYLFLNTWLPTYLAQELGLSLAASGLLTALFPAVGIVARSTSGAVSDRVFGGRRRAVVLTSFAAAAPALVAFVVAGSVPAVGPLVVVVGLLVVVGFAVQSTIAILYTYVAEVVDADVRTTAVALLTSGGLLGAFVGPLAAGVVIDVASYSLAFVLAGTVAGAGAGLAYLTPDT